MLIRIKVLQILYAWYQNGSKNLKAAENEILLSLQKSYNLYHFMLLLMVEMTGLQYQILANRKHKYQPTEEERNPNMRFVENRFIKQLAANKNLIKHAEENKLTWTNDPEFLKKVLAIVLASDEYRDYMASEKDSYDSDKNFWKDVFANHIFENEAIADFLEDKSIYWNDDVDIVATFVMKTIRQFQEYEGVHQNLLPMYSDTEDRDFAIKLLCKAITYSSEYREIIERNAKNWENERLAVMDVYVMQLAITEMLTFPSIPINVSLNEYIELAKYYSTPKSGGFVNGILNGIVEDLKKENRLLKA